MVKVLGVYNIEGEMEGCHIVTQLFGCSLWGHVSHEQKFPFNSGILHLHEALR